MSTMAVRFLKQENTQLKEKNEALQAENIALRRYVDGLKELYWVTQQTISEKNLLQLLDQILYNAMSALGTENGSLLLYDEEHDKLVFVLVHGDIRQELPGYQIATDVGIAGWAATNRKPLIVNNPRQDLRFSGTVDEAFSFVTRAILCVPMVARGKLIGVIELLNKKNGQDFVESDATLLSILSHMAAVSLDEVQSRFDAEEEIVKEVHAVV